MSGSHQRKAGVISVILMMFLTLSGCGSDARPAATVATPTQDPFIGPFLAEAGATVVEAECISEVLADSPYSSEPEDQELGKEVAQRIRLLGTSCGSEDRLRALAERMSTLVDEQLEKSLNPILAQIASRFEAAGASRTKSICIAEVLVAQDPTILTNEGNAQERADELGDFLASEASHCARPSQLRELMYASFVSPVLSKLHEAGASRHEATCIVESIDAIEIFTPSAEFNGRDSAAMAGDRFVENAPRCALAARMRRIVRVLFRNYQQGCTRTSDDPMAPFECPSD